MTGERALQDCGSLRVPHPVCPHFAAVRNFAARSRHFRTQVCYNGGIINERDGPPSFEEDEE